MTTCVFALYTCLVYHGRLPGIPRQAVTVKRTGVLVPAVLSFHVIGFVVGFVGVVVFVKLCLIVAIDNFLNIIYTTLDNLHCVLIKYFPEIGGYWETVLDKVEEFLPNISFDIFAERGLYQRMLFLGLFLLLLVDSGGLNSRL